jgi:hypothetical protein
VETVMEKATDNKINARFNDEIIFIDGIVETHPEIYTALSDEDREALQVYYLVGQPTPENVFEYRSELVRLDPHIQARAARAFNKLLAMLDIDDFKYTTKPT